jgi:hypothetical protein
MGETSTARRSRSQRARTDRGSSDDAKKRFVVSMNDEDYQSLKLRSFHEDRPMTVIVREAIHRYLA